MTAPFDLRGGRVVLGGRAVLDGVDFSVGGGEFVAVLGTNGSGKTTLVRSLVRLVPLAAGELTVFGTPVRRFHDWHRVGYVPQRPAPLGGVPVSVRELVLSGRTAKARRLLPWTPADRCAADCALEAVGLAGRARDPLAALSGGQQQRAYIARALAGDPEVLVLDEPTAGVDAESQEAFAAALRLLKEQGVAVLLVAHELGPLGGLLDRVVVLAAGEIAYEGPADAIDLHDPTHHDAHHPERTEPGRWLR